MEVQSEVLVSSHLEKGHVFCQVHGKERANVNY